MEGRRTTGELWSGSGEIYTPLTSTARQEGKIASWLVVHV